MFKKLKDKLAEEVKSSPQRIQQFAQAAQAAVTSASSSISDITNSDLFSIGENDNPQSRPSKSQSSLSSQNTFQDVALVQPLQSPTESADYMSSHDILENQTRQRRLSNSSFASDVSFRLPSYETPSMYHLQSDMEVSASEAEERGFSSGAVSLDRVTKEQLYSAYRRTQERYKKYRTQYGDLARHYKLLERENAKARSVLVETQDKALRRISELREQCALEQSAKAHLEKALRIELEEKNMKIETLNTKIQLLQSDPQGDADSINMNKVAEVENDVPLINLANDNDVKDTTDVAISEINTLNNKIEKMEQLLNKYKDSLKTSKEKNSQMTTEIQILSNELENKNKEIEILQHTAKDLATANNKIQELSNLNEELQNKINVYEFNKTREQSTLQLDLQKAQEEIIELKGKIEIFTKREEDYAISLAENKLSIHKELESKENEIKSLKDALEISKKEIQSLNIVIDDYKNNVTILESDKAKIQNECVELATAKSKVVELETKIEELSKKCHSLEQSKSKADEEYKCLQLQLKQETAEKLAMIDRNTYLENRNTQLGEDNSKKSSQISVLEAELKKRQMDQDVTASEDSKLNNELSVWKEKYAKLESEIQEERDELIKLQSEIEKLLVNHELIQTQNLEFRQLISDLKNENMSLLEQSNKLTNLESRYVHLKQGLQDLRKHITVTFDDTKSLQKLSLDSFNTLSKQINDSLNNITHTENDSINSKLNDLKTENERLETDLKAMIEKTKVMSIEITNLLDENNNLKGTVDKVKYEKQEINDNMKSATEKYDKIIHEVNSLKEINGILNEKANAYEHKIKDLQAAVDLESVRYRDVVEKLKSIENAEQKLQETHQNMLQKSELVATESNKLKSQCIILTEELEILKKENDCLLTKSKQLEDEKQNFNKLEDDIKILTRENQTLRNQHQSAQQEMDRGINFVTEELKKLKKDYENIADERDSLKKENDILVPQIEELKRKTENFIKLQEELNTLTDENLRKTEGLIKLQEELNTLTDENLSLKTQAESLSSSFKDMEVEINDLRERHTQMEAEKDRLNDIIEKLETSPNQTTEMRNNNIEEVSSNVTLGDSYTQTEVVEPSINNIPVIENVHAIHVTENQAPKQSSNDNNSELQEKYIHVKEEYDLLKEENRRLKSDIEGLQTYLTKISKENSVLNDKLRESIATSEHSIENNDSIDVVELKNEIQSWKDKNEDLLRENNFLIEENLELKDQLQSQNYSKPAYNSMDDGANDVFPKEKYNDLLQKNSSLEKRLLDLENMNKSVNVNLLQMQDKNDKLRSSNEKLERRLDEALVSLRHLHSLQENTELEYLRNILYEYLTGPGIHSVTLAKVLSAIVKFDDMQTKLVLQKEKERQGFLRQLGII